ncbi:TPA: hypothetical protein ACJFUF_001040 [Yersinia enterocolitica]
MKELDSFTVEQLTEFIESDHAQCGDVSALARIALAAKRAEPVYQYHTGIINEEGDIDWYWVDCDKGFYSQYDNQHRRIVYTTPQLNSSEMRKLILSEVSDFCAGLGNPGEPELPEDIQQALMSRIELVFNNCG